MEKRRWEIWKSEDGYVQALPADYDWVYNAADSAVWTCIAAVTCTAEQASALAYFLL